MCTILGAGKISDFFKINWKENKWNLIVVLGAIIGGFIATHFLSNNTAINLNPKTIEELNALGFNNIGSNLVPTELFSWDAVLSTKGIAILIIGGFLIGFGTRYARPHL